MKHVQWILAFVLVLGATSPGAQGVVPPSTSDPARLRERMELPAGPTVPVRLPEFRATPQEPLPTAVRALRVRLSAIEVEGSTVYTRAQWQAQTQGYVGREVSGEEIFALAQVLTARYRNDGYFLSVVLVPPQSLTDGVLTLRVLEGHIASVRIEGDPRQRATLQEIGAKIRASRPLSAEVLERYLLIANDFPGLRLRSVLSPSETAGAADLTLIASVTEVEGFVSHDNYGSRYLGPNQGTLGLTANQVLGVNDQWRLIGAGTGNAEMAYGQLSYGQTLNAEGLTLTVAVSRARTRPGDSLRAFEVRGYSDAWTLTLGSPWLRTRNQSLLGRISYDHMDIRSDILGARVSEDHIRALRAGLGWRLLDVLDGQNTLDVDYSKGLGGTREDDVLKSRAGADGQFSKFTFDYMRNQALGGPWSLGLGLAGQWTPHKPLLSSEQFALGGRRYGRAYEAAELVGDRGWALRAEPRHINPAQGYWLRSWQLFGFYDVGQVARMGVQSAGTPSSQSLASAGVGTRLFLVGAATAQFEAAWPLTKPVASQPHDGKAVRLLASLLIPF
jgi:hemolysin activation/secretion protein